MKDGKCEEQKEREVVRNSGDFYLSWSQSQQTFELKRLSDDNATLLAGFVEIKVTHISSVFGQTDKVLEEIKQYEPKQNCQCIVGCIAMVDEAASELKVGDEVIAFVSSKWVKSRIRIPIEQVLKKPTFLSKEQAVVTSGIF